MNGENISKKVFRTNPIVLAIIFIFRSFIIITFYMIIYNGKDMTNGTIYEDINNIAGITLILVGIYNFLKQALQELTINNDHVTIKKGILIKDIEDIEYKKINNIKISNFLGFGNLKIYTGNDKPILFKYINNPKEVRKVINEKIEINSKQYINNSYPSVS